MSKPFAAKGVGACLKRVLNTRLTVGCLALGGKGAKGAWYFFSALCREAREHGAGRHVSAQPFLEHDDKGRVPIHPAPGESPACVSQEIEALYRQEATGLARIIARRTNDPDQARDIVHEAFLRIAHVSRKSTLLDRPQAYLRRIAANLLKDRHRMEVRRSTSLHVVADDSVLPSVDPHRQLECRDMLRRVDAAMLRLPDKTRQIFVAHRIEGLSYAEIAERTGLTVKGVEKQMSKALVALDRLVARS
jgi:RNA polymerase sigma factor (sigma-70 family)